MSYKTLLSGQIFTFDSVKEVLAKANEEKSGDVLAGVAAKSGLERIAAKEVLSQMTLEELRQNPAVPYEEDEVTRLNQDGINETIYGGIKSWTVGELREWLMAYTTGEEEIRRGWDRLCVLAMGLTEITGKEAIELARARQAGATEQEATAAGGEQAAQARRARSIRLLEAEGYRVAVLAQPEGKVPVEVVRDALLTLSTGFRTQEFISIDRVMRSSETLKARKQAAYGLHEQALHAALIERWGDPARSASLRLAAMASLGATRLALED